MQDIKRVLDFHSLDVDRNKHSHFSFWQPELTSDPNIIGRIHETLKNATELRLYITQETIEYSAQTEKHGWVYGSCKRQDYTFFEFGLSRTGRRFDIYGEDRKNKKVRDFFVWWMGIVKPYEDEFEEDFNI